jgi:hypothetical protein
MKKTTKKKRNKIEKAFAKQASDEIAASVDAHFLDGLNGLRDRAAVNAAIRAFYVDVEVAAKSHGIADVLVALAVNVAYDEAPGRVMSSMGLGDTFSRPQLAAYALGRAQDEVRKRINQLALGGGK